MHFTDRCAPARRIEADTIAAFTPTEWLRALALTYPDRLAVAFADHGRLTGTCGADGVLRIKLYR